MNDADAILALDITESGVQDFKEFVMAGASSSSMNRFLQLLKFFHESETFSRPQGR
jgi:hypothetical protein